MEDAICVSEDFLFSRQLTLSKVTHDPVPNAPCSWGVSFGVFVFYEFGGGCVVELIWGSHILSGENLDVLGEQNHSGSTHLLYFRQFFHSAVIVRERH